MKTFISASILITALGVTACSTSPVVGNGIKYEKDEVLSTAGDKSMPKWAEDGELQPWVIRDGKVYSVGITTLHGDDRPEAGARIAENNARANFSKTIENRMEFIFQGSEENASIDSTQAKWIGSEASSITSHNMSVEGHWWKRYAQTQDDGSRHIFYKVYALVTESEAELKQSIYAAIHKGETTHQLSPTFQKQVDSQWNRFVEGGVEPKPTDTSARQPATSEAQPSIQGKISE